jgi:hypothetical protein
VVVAALAVARATVESLIILSMFGRYGNSRGFLLLMGSCWLIARSVDPTRLIVPSIMASGRRRVLFSNFLQTIRMSWNALVLCSRLQVLLCQLPQLLLLVLSSLHPRLRLLRLLSPSIALVSSGPSPIMNAILRIQTHRGSRKCFALCF